jgi:hypothetical protein
MQRNILAVWLDAATIWYMHVLLAIVRGCPLVLCALWIADFGCVFACLCVGVLVMEWRRQAAQQVTCFY